jgi:hypothetical protein
MTFNMQQNLLRIELYYTINTEQFSSLKYTKCTKTFVTHSKIVDPLYIFQDKMQFQIFKKYFIDKYI